MTSWICLILGVIWGQSYARKLVEEFELSTNCIDVASMHSLFPAGLFVVGSFMTIWVLSGRMKHTGVVIWQIAPIAVGIFSLFAFLRPWIEINSRIGI